MTWSLFFASWRHSMDAAWPNKIGRANRRPTSPLNAGRQFESASCAPPSLSAPVAHLGRSLTSIKGNTI